MSYTIIGALLGWLLHWAYTNYKKELQVEKEIGTNEQNNRYNNS